VDSGAIGTPLLFHSAHRNPSVPSHYTADMAINDTAAHDIDVARWLLDDEVAAASVLKPRRNSRAGALQDPLLVLLEMSSGALVDVEVSVTVAYGYDIRGETGTAGLAESNNVVVKREGAFWRAAAGRLAGALPARLRPRVPGLARRGRRGHRRWSEHLGRLRGDDGLRCCARGAAHRRPASRLVARLVSGAKVGAGSA
jgi:myo-inositol 2-dehydrogenase / D-chiro-inositol 1-dehydrogenase